MQLEHLSFDFSHKLIFLLTNPPNNIPKCVIEKTLDNPKSFCGDLPQAMPIECKSTKSTVHGCVKAYRRYYMSVYKEHLVSWTIKEENIRKSLEIPKWWI